MIDKADVLDALRGTSGLVGLFHALGIHDYQTHASGRERFTIRCIAHDDHSPSLGFFEASGVWMCKCLSCGFGGDMFHFVGRAEGIGEGDEAFPRILNRMAELLGVVERSDEGREEAERRRAERKRQAEEQRARHESVAAAKRAAAIAQAVKVWDAAEPHERRIAAEYFEHRGVRIADLPGGELPKAIRFLPDAYRKYYTGQTEILDDGSEAKVTREERVPAVICGAVDWRRTIVMVQRIYLEADERGVRKISYGLDAKGKLMQKQTLGSGSMEYGACVRLSGRNESGTLILCEGIETGMAILAACKGDAEGAVWCCVSAEGLKKFGLHRSQVHPDLFADWDMQPPPEECNGWVRRVIVAGDLDRSNAGQRAAVQCASNLLKAWGQSGLEVKVAIPSWTQEDLARVIEHLSDQLRRRNRPRK